MRLATVRDDNGTTAAAVAGTDQLALLDAPDVGTLLQRPDWQASASTASGLSLPLEGAEFAPVVPQPGKMICLGHNFRSHLEEMGRPLPEYPTMFAKTWTALIGARDQIQLPTNSDQVDWEAELGVVIGRTVGPGVCDTAGAIAGYTVVNDISVRDWQNRTTQWFQGKNFDHTTPIGPWLVTADEITDPASLRIRCEVDGELVQDSNTSDFIFDPEVVIGYVSSFMTLQPGDVLSLGTPGGVGAARRPPIFLRAGQVVRTTIDGIGELVNRCGAPV